MIQIRIWEINDEKVGAIKHLLETNCNHDKCKARDILMEMLRDAGDGPDVEQLKEKIKEAGELLVELKQQPIVGKAEYITTRGLGESAARSSTEYNQEEPIWISEMVLILGAERFIDRMRAHPGTKIHVLDKDTEKIVSVFPETVKIPYLGNLMPNCRCVPAGCQVNVGAGGYVGVRKLFHAKE